MTLLCTYRSMRSTSGRLLRSINLKDLVDSSLFYIIGRFYGQIHRRDMSRGFERNVSKLSMHFFLLDGDLLTRNPPLTVDPMRGLLM
jgi:hypothetical protein